jgi:flavin reductase (DIM6/NTAB) family NADH-FMN oxidoreductase RutF
VDRDAFDEVMQRRNTDMMIMTTAVSGQRAGCLVGFHSQCSIDPDRYAVWLSKANHTCQLALRATHFGLHFLDRRHFRLAEIFGTLCSDEVDKFALTSVHEGPHGVPVLDECTDWIVARRTAFLEEGSDHICFITEPVEAAAGSGREPLRFADVASLTAGHEAEDRSARRNGLSR